MYAVSRVQSLRWCEWGKATVC